MLIPEMAFIFHNRKQAEAPVTLNKLSKPINSSSVIFYSNERFHSLLIKQRVDNGHESANLWFRSKVMCLNAFCSFIKHRTGHESVNL